MIVWAMRKRLHWLAGGPEDSHVVRVDAPGSSTLSGLRSYPPALTSIIDVLAGGPSSKIHLHAVSCPCLAPHEISLINALAHLQSEESSKSLSQSLHRRLHWAPVARLVWPAIVRSWRISTTSAAVTGEGRARRAVRPARSGRAPWCTDPPLAFAVRDVVHRPRRNPGAVAAPLRRTRTARETSVRLRSRARTVLEQPRSVRASSIAASRPAGPRNKMSGAIRGTPHEKKR